MHRALTWPQERCWGGGCREFEVLVKGVVGSQIDWKHLERGRQLSKGYVGYAEQNSKGNGPSRTKPATAPPTTNVLQRESQVR